MAATGPKLVISGDDDLSAPAFSAPDERASTVIEYSAKVIDLIRAETVAALLSIPHGGLEIAGVLFGRRTGRTVYVAARRSIECEHSSGPSFALSAKDAERLELLLDASQSDPELDGLEVLGWYVSHTRRPFSMVPGDVEIFDRFFHEPLKITSVIQPAATGKARFGWFVRDEDGSVDTERPSSEFTVYPSIEAPSNGTAAYAPETIDSRADKALMRRSRWEEERAGTPLPIDPPGKKLFVPPRGQVRLSNRVLITAGLMVLLAGGAVFLFRRLSPEGMPPPPLHVLDTGTQLRIDWDPKLALVQQARSGVLEIKEPFGEPVGISLSQDMLRSGSVFYDKPSSKVEVHLKLKDEKGLVSESMVYFIGREPEPKKPVDEILAVTTEPAPLPVPVQVPTKSPPPAADKGAAERARSVGVSTRAFRPPVFRRALPSSEPSLVEPPKIAIPQSQAGVPLHTEVAVAAPPPLVAPPVVNPAVVAQAPKSAAQPTSGRLIWTGELHKGAVLHLTDYGPSTGSLNGKLPARPIKVSVHSAELLDGVIAVYTSDANSTRTAEAPGRRNGWNVTMYKFDPKHVRDLSLVETPAQDNNFRLGIKSNNRPVSIIVIDWRATN